MTIPHDQIAAAILEEGAPVFYHRRPVPVPGDDQLLIKLTAAAVNPIDYKLQEGYFTPSYPVMLGQDCAGTVVACGKDVKNFSVGDKVFYQSKVGLDDHAAFQEYNVAIASITAKIPPNITDVEAASIPLGASCAVVGLAKEAGVPLPHDGPIVRGKTILVVGGSSSCGQYTIQVARLMGFSTIITTASPKHWSFLRSLGATHLIDRNVSNVVDEINSILSSEKLAPLSVIYDTISLPSTNKLVLDVLDGHPSLTNETTTVLLLLPAWEGLIKGNEARKHPIKIVNFVLGSSPLHRDVAEPFWQRISRWLEQGTFVPNRVEVVEGGLMGLQKALEKLKAGVSGVKLVVRIEQSGE